MASVGGAVAAEGGGRLNSQGNPVAAAARWVRATNLRLALAIGFLALVLRVIWVLSVERHGFAFNDALFYDLIGQQLATGKGFTLQSGAPTAAWPPVYPFVLSLGFRVFGHAELVGRLINAVIGAATVPILYLAALRAFGRREAVFAATVLALFPAQIFLTDVLISETLNTFMLVSLFALLTLLRPTRAAAAVVGILIGLATLTRGENALLVIVPMVVWWPQLTPRLRAIRLGILVLAVALVLTPWTIRNENRMHATLLVSTNAGQTLYAAHNPHATGGTTFPPPSLIAKQQREPDPQREVDTDSVLRSYAEHWALHHPAQELLLIPERVMSLLGNDGALFPTWVNPGASTKPAIGPQGTARLALLTAMAWYGLLAAFAVTLLLAWKPLWRGPRDPGRKPVLRGALTWIVTCVTIYGIVFFGQWRYHVSLEPLMILIVAPAACAAWSARSQLADRLVGASRDVERRGEVEW
jgi:4-amino-4-deoxy-L-arabinose transferase-like glycosyltransferase